MAGSVAQCNGAGGPSASSEGRVSSGSSAAAGSNSMGFSYQGGKVGQFAAVISPLGPTGQMDDTYNGGVSRSSGSVDKSNISFSERPADPNQPTQQQLELLAKGGHHY